MDTFAFGDAWAFSGINGYRRALGRGLKIKRARIIAVREYLKAMSISGTWGGELEIAASARVIPARINVYSDNGDEELILCASYGCEDTECVINLLYDGISHYDGLEKQDGEFTIVESYPNGDCLFTSMSGGSLEEGLELRQKIVRDLQSRKKELIGFFAFPDNLQRKRPLTQARTRNRKHGRR